MLPRQFFELVDRGIELSLMCQVILQSSCRFDCAGDIIKHHSVLHSEVVKSSLGQYSAVELAPSSFG